MPRDTLRWFNDAKGYGLRSRVPPAQQYDASVERSNLTPAQRRRLAQVSIDAAYDFLRDAADDCPELRPHVEIVLAELDRATATLGVREEVERVITRRPFSPKS